MSGLERPLRSSVGGCERSLPKAPVFFLRLKTSGISQDHSICVERNPLHASSGRATCEQPHRFFDCARLPLLMKFLSISDLLKPPTCIRREIMSSLAPALLPHTA